MLEELHIVEMENVSEKYINCMTALLWRCSKGHEWNAPLSNIKKQIHDLLWKCVKGHIWHATLNAIKDRNTWCPICRNKYENLCREIVSKYLGPPSGHNFAIEVQDPQHEKYIEFFHRDPNNFIKQQARDQLKKELCEENQIALRYV
ncbi:hypothetical protein GLOIN_2v1022074 [Rhizophagus irregularis DAOM 181602=DAOM 197198]|nr:hypothetical protein GLOIN_2v1022074 [Rhizophagus irregularis DAOM 181602=DAOM 197198]